MFERFTDQAINSILLAQEESRRMGHNFIGSEQLLLGQKMKRKWCRFLQRLYERLLNETLTTCTASAIKHQSVLVATN